jgi:hypothetical protein
MDSTAIRERSAIQASSPSLKIYKILLKSPESQTPQTPHKTMNVVNKKLVGPAGFEPAHGSGWRIPNGSPGDRAFQETLLTLAHGIA